MKRVYPEGHGTQQRGVPRFSRKAGAASKEAETCSTCASPLTPNRRVHLHGEGTLCYSCWKARWSNL